MSCCSSSPTSPTWAALSGSVCGLTQGGSSATQTRTPATQHRCTIRSHLSHTCGRHRLTTGFFVGVYVGWTVLAALLVYAKEVVFAFAAKRAAGRLHDALLCRVLGAPMAWFDVTPLGYTASCAVLALSFGGHLTAPCCCNCLRFCAAVSSTVSLKVRYPACRWCV